MIMLDFKSDEFVYCQLNEYWKGLIYNKPISRDGFLWNNLFAKRINDDSQLKIKIKSLNTNQFRIFDYKDFSIYSQDSNPRPFDVRHLLSYEFYDFEFQNCIYAVRSIDNSSILPEKCEIFFMGRL